MSACTCVCVGFARSPPSHWANRPQQISGTGKKKTQKQIQRVRRNNVQARAITRIAKRRAVDHLMSVDQTRLAPDGQSTAQWRQWQTHSRTDAQNERVHRHRHRHPCIIFSFRVLTFACLMFVSVCVFSRRVTSQVVSFESLPIMSTQPPQFENADKCRKCNTGFSLFTRKVNNNNYNREENQRRRPAGGIRGDSFDSRVTDGISSFSPFIFLYRIPASLQV